MVLQSAFLLLLVKKTFTYFVELYVE